MLKPRMLTRPLLLALLPLFAPACKREHKEDAARLCPLVADETAPGHEARNGFGIPVPEKAPTSAANLSPERLSLGLSRLVDACAQAGTPSLQMQELRQISASSFDSVASKSHLAILAMSQRESVEAFSRTLLDRAAQAANR